MAEIPKRPDGELAYEDTIPRFVWETCNFCGGDEADKTDQYVRHLHAVAVRAVEALKHMHSGSAPRYDGECYECRALRDIKASGWKP